MHLSKIFKTKKGQYVIGQFPNWPLWLALFFFILKNTTSLFYLSQWGITLSLLYWSYLEITKGVNDFRKGIGLFVALLQIAHLTKLILGLVV